MQKYNLTVMKKFLIFCMMCAWLPSLANADQCALIPQDVAEKAYTLLSQSKDYTDFCAPCNDTEPVTKQIKTLDIQSVYLKYADETLYQILINDKPIDIAYIYINGKNLGMQANCTPISMVPEYIDDFLTGRWKPDDTSL